MGTQITISTKSNPVLVCGAGFSHAGGCPLQRDLAATVIPEGMARIHNITRGRPSDAPIDIEEFLTSIDFEDLVAPTRRRKDRLNSRSYLHSLAVEIYNATAATTQSPLVLRNFFGQVAKLWHFVDVVVTTNWDTLLECFGRSQYGSIDLLGRDLSAKRLLKVHGSIDWFAVKSTEIQSRSLAHFVQILDRYYRYVPFSEGNDLFRIYKSAVPIVDGVPAMIAPTHLKEVPGGLFRRIWTAAFYALQQTRHLIVIGYSLPPSDRLMAELLVACRLPHVRSDNTIERARISIVDPDPNGIVRQRFEALLGSDIEFFRVGFTDLEIEGS